MRKVIVPVMLFAACGLAAADSLEERMKEADRAFFADTEARGIEGWLDWYADDGARVVPGGPIVQGKQGIRMLDTPLLANPNLSLRWQPKDARAFADGKSGFTRGPYRVIVFGDDGAQLVGVGEYLTIWREDETGLKVVLDTGSPGNPAILERAQALVAWKKDPNRPRGSWADWDDFFNSEGKSIDVVPVGDKLRTTQREINDWYRLLDRPPAEYYMTYSFDAENQVTERKIGSIPDKPRDPGRLAEFEAWAREHHPGLLEKLMPEGEIDPSLANAKLWKQHLLEWRAAAGLPNPLP